MKTGTCFMSLTSLLLMLLFIAFLKKTHWNTLINPIGTGRPGDVTEGLLNALMFRTYRGLSRDSHKANAKIDDSMKKLFFRGNSSGITHLFLFL